LNNLKQNPMLVCTVHLCGQNQSINQNSDNLALFNFFSIRGIQQYKKPLRWNLLLQNIFLYKVSTFTRVASAWESLSITTLHKQEMFDALHQNSDMSVTCNVYHTCNVYSKMNFVKKTQRSKYREGQWVSNNARHKFTYTYRGGLIRKLNDS
jgi:hypothetical protein